MSTASQRKDAEQSQRLKALRTAAAKARCLELKRMNPEMPAPEIAARLGIGLNAVIRWIREAGLTSPHGTRWAP